MPQKLTWRVRVMRAVEVWVEVAADNATQAEEEAMKRPGVISVFGRSAVPADNPVEGQRPIGVQD